jgi:hypothetical protein
VSGVRQAVTRDDRVGIYVLVAALFLTMLAVYGGIQWIMTTLAPKVCVSSMMVEVGQPAVVNEMTCH